ncbi:MAG: SNF2-related protein [Bacillota bacterium]
MKLLDQLEKNVPKRIFQRGKNYYKQGKIKDYHINYTEDNRYEIRARVRGSYNYQINIDLKIIEDDLYFNNSCTCPYDWGDVCKHEVAVLYKFLKEDYEGLDGPGRFKSLLEVTKKFQDKEKTSLNYYVKGFLTDSMVNFKITLEDDNLNTEILNEILAYAHNSDFPYYDRGFIENYLTNKDKFVIDYLAQIQTRKSRSDASLLFNKNRANFNFLLNLIENNDVYFSETNKKAEVGQKLYPNLNLKGDEEEVKFEINSIYEIYESEDEFDKVYWTVIDNIVRQFDYLEAKKLPKKVQIPEKEKGRFLFEVIEDLKKKFEVNLPEDLKKHRLLEHLPEIFLKFDYKEGTIFCHAEVEIDQDKYLNSEILSIEPDEKEYERLDKESNLWSVWKLEECGKLINFLERYNFHVSPDEFVIKDDISIQNFITDGFVHVPEEWEIETTEAFDNIEINEVELDPVFEFKESNDDQIDWFEFEISYNLGGKTYSRNKIMDMMRYNDQGQAYIKIDDNYFLLNEGEKEKKAKKALNLAEKDNKGDYRSHFYNLLYYKKVLEENGIEFEGNRVYNQLEEDITGDSLIKKEGIPQEVENKLRDYQKEGYYWFKFIDKYNFGGILADDMGLGKTVQSLTFLKNKNSDKPALIICPRTLIHNWGEEIEKFFSDIDYLIYHSNPEEREEMRSDFSAVDIIITSYSIISRDHEKLADYTFSTCILDEAQRIKNHRTKRAKGVKKINAERRLALTGTPLENSLEELWSIFDFLMPGYLGGYNNFRKSYLNPVKNDNNDNKLVELKKRVAPFILRRKKEDVLTELPDKVLNIHKVDMNSLQEDTYKTVLEQLKGDLEQRIEEKGFNKSRINVLSALTKLRQVCNHPSLILDRLEEEATSGKIEALMELVEEAIQGGHKLIVFSQFVQMLKIIKTKFNEKEIDYEYLDGSTRKRMERVRHFNSDEETKVFLISLKAGGTGLNLTSADIVIHVDPWWNPMVERQASDRAHRIGQDKRVIVYKLITRGTVEEKMLKLQKKKKNIFDRVIEDNPNPIDSITWDDIQELLNYN